MQDGSKMIVVREVLHNIFHTAVQDIAQAVYGVDFQIHVFAEPIQYRTVDVMVGVQVILGNAAPLHCFPKSIIFDHALTSRIGIKI